MKNLHLIPTDKPSRLSILNSGKLNFGAEAMSSSNSKLQHIYITSDEEIKEDDWMIWNNRVVQAIDTVYYSGKKIILTTDQDLIADGVQAIDDEFLEWFVQNPSCEWVDLDTFSTGNKVLYNVVFPKEEPKQETLEEAARRYTESTTDNDPIRIFSFIAGAKSEAARDYWFEQFKNKGGDK
jgi:hypothetical protein